MIQKVVLRRFKRFQDTEVPLGDHVVFAGPNNQGKTTVLQAIAAWSVAFEKWRAENRLSPRKGAYPKAHLTRQDFSAVPLRRFDLLWHQSKTKGPVEIELYTDAWALTMRFEWDNKETATVRPKADAALTPEVLRAIDLRPVYVAPMSGLLRDEPVHDDDMQRELIGQGKPGDILRNLLYSAHRNQPQWEKLQKSIRKLFGYELAPPRKVGAYIDAGYSERVGGVRLDVASAGSGFLQVLMLLAFLYTREGSVLLVDEPDAHLHMILQGVIYGELERIAAAQRSQLIVATHSEVVIGRASAEQLRVLTPSGVREFASRDARALQNALRAVTQVDVAVAVTAPGVLYVEGYTDHNLLQTWADVLKHPAADTLRRVLVKTVCGETDDEPVGESASAHYPALMLLLGEPRPGLELLDGDSKNKGPGQVTGAGLQRLRWLRYEAESYLVHPTALDRFVVRQLGEGGLSQAARDALRRWFEKTFQTGDPAVFLEDSNPLVKTFLKATKARGDILPPALEAAGIVNLPYTRYEEIAAVMLPEEIHPEVKEKLDAIQRAFGL